MAFQRGRALVPSVARVVQLTATQDLRNLEATGELDLGDLLVTASDAVFDRLTTDGIDPEALTNAEVYERAVAYQFLGLLALGGYLEGQEHIDLFEASDRFYLQVKARLSSGDEPRNATEGVPHVLNLPLPRIWPS